MARAANKKFRVRAMVAIPVDMVVHTPDAGSARRRIRKMAGNGTLLMGESQRAHDVDFRSVEEVEQY